MSRANLNSGNIAAVGITNQRETAVVWDRHTGKPVYNAIVWQDTRTQKIVDELAADGGLGRYKDVCGLPLATYFSGPKVTWILDNVDGAREQAEAGELLFGNTDTWVLWNLTGGAENDGVHVTDVTNASRTMLMNLSTLTWDESIAADMGDPDVDAARDQVLLGGVRRVQARRAQRRPDRRHPRRPAGGDLRPGLPGEGHRQEHLRHRQLHAAQHRRPSRCPARTAC